MILAIRQPKPRQQFPRPPPPLRTPHARIGEWHLDVFQSRTLRQQQKGLEQEPENAIADVRHPVCSQAGDIDPVEPIASAAGAVQAAE